MYVFSPPPNAMRKRREHIGTRLSPAATPTMCRAARGGAHRAGGERRPATRATELRDEAPARLARERCEAAFAEAGSGRMPDLRREGDIGDVRVAPSRDAPWAHVLPDLQKSGTSGRPMSWQIDHQWALGGTCWGRSEGRSDIWPEMGAQGSGLDERSGATSGDAREGAALQGGRRWHQCSHDSEP